MHVCTEQQCVNLGLHCMSYFPVQEISKISRIAPTRSPFWSKVALDSADISAFLQKVSSINHSLVKIHEISKKSLALNQIYFRHIILWGQREKSAKFCSFPHFTSTFGTKVLLVFTISEISASTIHFSPK